MMIYTVDGPRQLHKTAWMKNEKSIKKRERSDKKLGSRGPGIPGLYYFTCNSNGDKSLKSKRIFWLLVYAACVSLCAIQMSERLEYFLQYPMTMSLTAQRVTTWRYPDITICPFHGFKSGRILYDTLDRFCPSPNRTGNCSYRVYDMLDYEYKNITKLWDMTGNELWDTVMNCSYEGNIPCNVSAYWRIDHTIMGRCFTLSIPHRIVNGGPWVGIEVLLKEPFHEASIELSHLRWKVLLHENDTVLEYSSLTRSTMVYRQTRTALMFWKKEYYYESTPINPCTSMEAVRDCLAICFDRQFLQNNTCRLPFMKTLRNAPLCTNSMEFSRAYLMPVHKNEFQDNIDACNCGRSCREVTYEFQPDSKIEPTFNHTRVIVYPTGSDIEIVRERRAYPLNALVSDLGGALGLYLGVCILTFMDTLRFAIRAIMDRASIRNRTSD